MSSTEFQVLDWSESNVWNWILRFLASVSLFLFFRIRKEAFLSESWLTSESYLLPVRVTPMPLLRKHQYCNHLFSYSFWLIEPAHLMVCWILHSDVSRCVSPSSKNISLEWLAPLTEREQLAIGASGAPFLTSWEQNLPPEVNLGLSEWKRSRWCDH